MLRGKLKVIRGAGVLLVVVLLLGYGCSFQSSGNRSATPTPNASMVIEETITPEPSPDIEATIIAMATAMQSAVGSEQYDQFQASFLEGPCTAPCWFDIEPGRSTVEEIPPTLDRLEETGIIQGYKVTQEQDWVVYHITAVGGSYIEIHVVNGTGLVEAIVFSLAGPVLTLGDVIAVYGEADLVSRGREGENFKNVALVYPDLNFLLEAGTTLSEEMISKDMEIVYGYYVAELILPDKTWLPWEGYRPFNYYYDQFVVPDPVGEASGQ